MSSELSGIRGAAGLEDLGVPAMSACGSRRRPLRCAWLLVLAVVVLANQFAYAQIPLNQRVLVVYNSVDSGSTAVANYYVASAIFLLPIFAPSLPHRPLA